MARTNKRVFTSREVRASYYIDQWLLVRDSAKANEKWDKKSWRMDENSEEIKSRSLQQCILEEISFQEAMLLKMNFDGKNEKLNRKTFIDEFLFQVKDWPPWEEMEISEKELNMIVERKWISKNILQLKTKSFAVDVSEQEAKTYFENNKAKFGSLPFSALSANISDFLKQQKLKDQLKDWFEILSKKNKVQFLLKR